MAGRDEDEPSDTDNARLTFEHVSHQYDGLASVRDVSISVMKGEVLCLLGHSGCGKTTLLRIAAGVESQSQGRVLIDGKEVAGPAGFVPPEKRQVGLMFQDYALFPHMSILDNVLFGLKGGGETTIRHHATETLKRVGLGDYLNDYPHVLSGGEQQRVALARALAPQPSVLLMDEPFSGLDRRLRDRVRFETLDILRRSEATCIIVTHDPEEAMQVADRIALMHEGRLVQVGQPEEIYLKPNSPFAARFFSDLNEMECEVVEGKIVTPFGPISADSIRDGNRAWVGIRPHDLEIAQNGSGRAAKVLSHRFLGEVDSVEIQLDGSPETVQLRLPTRHGNTWPESINLVLKQDRALIFNLPSLEQ